MGRYAEGMNGTTAETVYRRRMIRDEIADVQALIDAEQALLDANPADWAARIRLFGLRGRLARLQAQVVSE